MEKKIDFLLVFLWLYFQYENILSSSMNCVEILNEL